MRVLHIYSWMEIDRYFNFATYAEMQFIIFHHKVFSLLWVYFQWHLCLHHRAFCIYDVGNTIQLHNAMAKLIVFLCYMQNFMWRILLPKGKQELILGHGVGWAIVFLPCPQYNCRLWSILRKGRCSSLYIEMFILKELLRQ